MVAARQRTLTAAYAAYPERFVRRPPVAGAPPTEVWINKPPDPAAQHQVGPAAPAHAHQEALQ
ncbi:MAG: hypothetical protein GYA57_06775 [Myxococcales bacterium]|nr:hypothetical protein [Myxococcales bacterium]